MPIPFECPHCGKQFQVDDHLAGKTGPCPACQQPVTILSVNPDTSPIQSREGSVGPTAAVPRRGKGRIIGVIIGLILIGGVGLATLAFFAAFSAKYSMQCAANLKELGLAMHNYHDSHECFPPATIIYEDGSEGQSWRVAVLPFLREDSLHLQFDSNQPWDSEQNLKAAEHMPAVFQCPGAPKRFKEIKGHKVPCTNYVMIVGERIEGSRRFGTVGGSVPPRYKVKMANITDGTSNTLMIVEVKGDNCPAWTEPVNLDVNDLLNGINAAEGTPSIGSHHRRSANVVMVDGTVYRFPSNVEPELLLKLGMKDDGVPAAPQDALESAKTP